MNNNACSGQERRKGPKTSSANFHTPKTSSANSPLGITGPKTSSAAALPAHRVPPPLLIVKCIAPLTLPIWAYPRDVGRAIEDTVYE